VSTTIAEQEVALVDLVDRLLGGGVVIAGDITLSVAEVDLVRISLRALITAAGKLDEGHVEEQLP
jgi:hypothetical protein